MSRKFSYLIDVIMSVINTLSFPRKRESSVFSMAYADWIPDQVRDDTKTQINTLSLIQSLFSSGLARYASGFFHGEKVRVVTKKRLWPTPVVIETSPEKTAVDALDKASGIFSSILQSRWEKNTIFKT